MFHKMIFRNRNASVLVQACTARAIVLLLSLLFGVSTHSVQISAADHQTFVPVQITDDLGHTFRFTRPAQRIVSLTPGYTETLFALGAGNRVVGVDDYSDYPSEARSRAKVGGGQRANLERIVALQPDFVVALVEQQEVDTLVAKGIPAVRLFPTDFNGVLQTILLLGRVTGTEQCAQEIVAGMNHQLAEIEDRVKGLPQPSVFVELDGTDPLRPFTPGPHSFIGDMIRTAGGWNIAHNIHTPSSQISLEAIVAEDPEIIVLTDSKNPINPQSKEDVLKRQGWAGITAVRNGAVVSVDDVFFFRPGPRFVDGIELLARIFHPEAFR
jgi:iron complex transport system substrate-binding protein